MKVEKELDGLEYLFLLNLFGAFVALGLAAGEYLMGVRGVAERVHTDGFYLALTGGVFATGLCVTSVLLCHDPREKHAENGLLMHAGNWTELGGVGITQDPAMLMGVLWTLGGLAALSITIYGLFS